MEGVNGNVLLPLTNDGLPNSSNSHLHNLLSAHPDLSSQQIAEASASAHAATAAAKAARATAIEKAAAAAKAVAAAQTALDLVASFPRTDPPVAAHLPQPGDVSIAIMPNSTCEPRVVNAIPKRVDFSDLGMVLNSDRPGGEGAKEAIQVARKRGRPKSK